MPTRAVVENCITIIATAALVLGLYSLGAGGWAAGGFLLMINLNFPSKREPAEKPAEPTSEQLGRIV